MPLNAAIQHGMIRTTSTVVGMTLRGWQSMSSTTITTTTTTTTGIGGRSG